MHPFVLLALVTFHVPLALVVQLVISTLLPLVVALVTRYDDRPNRKALVLLGLGILSSGLTEFASSLANHNPFDIGLWLLAAIGSFVVGAATHFGLWRTTAMQRTLALAGPKPRRAQG